MLAWVTDSWLAESLALGCGDGSHRCRFQVVDGKLSMGWAAFAGHQVEAPRSKHARLVLLHPILWKGWREQRLRAKHNNPGTDSEAEQRRAAWKAPRHGVDAVLEANRARKGSVTHSDTRARRLREALPSETPAGHGSGP